MIYVHGASEEENAVTFDPLKAPITEALQDAGYFVASAWAGGNNWGNRIGVAAYAELYRHMVATYDITRTVVWAQSMGGLTALTAIASGEIPAKGWLGIYPSCNLADAYDIDHFLFNIRDAFGFQTDGEYPTRTAGYDPVLHAAGAYNGVRFRFLASPDDTVVPKSTNTDVMAAHIAAVTPEHDIVVCSGAHGDPSHFDLADTLAFFDRCV